MKLTVEVVRLLKLTLVMRPLPSVTAQVYFTPGGSQPRPVQAPSVLSGSFPPVAWISP